MYCTMIVCNIPPGIPMYGKGSKEKVSGGAGGRRKEKITSTKKSSSLSLKV